MDNLVKSHQDSVRKNILNSFGFVSEVNFVEGEDQGLLKKGILSYQLTSSPTFTISKSGKLIKEKLEGIKALAVQKLSEVQIKSQSLRVQITEEPSQETSDYDTIMNLRIQPIPKTYSWDQIRPSQSSGPQDYSLNSEVSKKCENGDLMSQYNDTVYQYSSYKKDIAMIETMLTNFQDNKNYDLSVEQATIFGF